MRIDLICFNYFYIKNKTSQEQTLSILLLQQFFKTYFVCVCVFMNAHACKHPSTHVEGYMVNLQDVILSDTLGVLEI